MKAESLTYGCGRRVDGCVSTVVMRVSYKEKSRLQTSTQCCRHPPLTHAHTTPPHMYLPLSSSPLPTHTPLPTSSSSHTHTTSHLLSLPHTHHFPPPLPPTHTPLPTSSPSYTHTTSYLLPLTQIYTLSTSSPSHTYTPFPPPPPSPHTHTTSPLLPPSSPHLTHLLLIGAQSTENRLPVCKRDATVCNKLKQLPTCDMSKNNATLTAIMRYTPQPFVRADEGYDRRVDRKRPSLPL